jgi:hypothetical protein
MLNLHPKIRAAALAAVAVAVVTVGNQVIDVYQDQWWTGMLAAGLVAFAGWLKRAE